MFPRFVLSPGNCRHVLRSSMWKYSNPTTGSKMMLYFLVKNVPNFIFLKLLYVLQNFHHFHSFRCQKRKESSIIKVSIARERQVSSCRKHSWFTLEKIDCRGIWLRNSQVFSVSNPFECIDDSFTGRRCASTKKRIFR